MIMIVCLSKDELTKPKAYELLEERSKLIKFLGKITDMKNSIVCMKCNRQFVFLTLL
jgi:ribosomal protein S2